MMYYCKDCGEVHDEAELEYEPIYDSGDGSRGAIMFSEVYCPSCGSDELVEAERCPVCGEYYDGEGQMCASCEADVKALWLNLLENLPDGADAGEVATYIAEVLV